MNETFIPYRVAAHYLSTRLVEEGMDFPAVGVICGSGLSELSKALEGPTLSVNYSDIPGFPAHCTVAGHEGEVVFGKLSGVPACCFRGRFHSYEGHDMKTTVLPVTVMRCLRVKVVIVTNAAGGLNPEYNVGDVVFVTDHLAIPQLAGKNPLVGPNDDELGPRFPATSNAYSDVMRKVAKEASDQLGLDFVKTHGTYCFVSGPMYESKAECRFLKALGGGKSHTRRNVLFSFSLIKAPAPFSHTEGLLLPLMYQRYISMACDSDCVGMSTIPEVVTAHHCNMQVLCLSLITNKVIMEGDEGPAANHAEVLEAVGKRSIQMQGFVKQIIKVLNQGALAKIPDLSPVALSAAKSQYDATNKKSPSVGGVSFETLLFGAACAVAGSMFSKMVRGSH